MTAPSGPTMCTRDPRALPELAAVLGAREPRRFRRLTLVCSQDHRHALVYGTGVGPVLLAETPMILAVDEGPDGAPVVEGYTDGRAPAHDDRRDRGRRARAHRVAVRLDEEPDPAWLEVSCRCRTVLLRAGWLRAQLAAGHRRVLVDTWTPLS